MGKRLRPRGTAVVIKNGKVLLVRDRGRRHFSLPGGGQKKDEPSVSAAARELYEELGLKAMKIDRLPSCDVKGTTSHHKVCLIEAVGRPRLKRNELVEYTWWDMKRSLPIYGHVKGILGHIGLL